MEIQLDAFKAPTKMNTRTSQGQNFTGIKYRDATFILSNELFDKIGVAGDDVSLKVEINPTNNQVLLLKVGGQDGNVFKRTPKTGVEKSKSFTSSVIEKALDATGLVKMGAEGSQTLDLEEATSGGNVVGYIIVAGGSLKKAEAKATTTVAYTNSTTSTSPAPSPVADEEVLGTDTLSGENLTVDSIPDAVADEFEDKF